MSVIEADGVVVHVPVNESEDLQDLVRRINELHGRVIARGREALENAIVCGEALNEAESRVEPGMWSYWFHQHFTMHITTSQIYRRVAKHKDIVRAKDARSIADAIRILEDEPRHLVGPHKYREDEVAEMVDLAGRIGCKPAARELGVSPSTVHKYFQKHSPTKAPAVRKITVGPGAVERVAIWLCDHVPSYPATPNFKVKRDALDLLKAARGDAPTLRDP